MERRKKGTGTIVKQGDTYYGRIKIRGKVKVVRLSKNARESEGLWKEWLAVNVGDLRKDVTRHEIDTAWPAIRLYLVGKGTSEDELVRRETRWLRMRLWLAVHNVKHVEDITKADVLGCVEDLCQGQAQNTKQKMAYLFRSLFAAVGMSEPYPCDGLRFRQTKSVAREPLTTEEVQKVLDEAGRMGADWAALIETGLYTGLRLTDCVHLSTQDVRDGVIQLVPRKTERHGTMVRIPLHPRLAESLAALGVESGPYFPRLAERYASRLIAGSLQRLFRRALGAEQTVTRLEGRRKLCPVKGFHALRATFLTRLAEAGVSLPIMESIAGHLRGAQTMHYTHPAEDTKRAAVEALPDFAAGTAGKKYVAPETALLIDWIDGRLDALTTKLQGETMAKSKAKAKEQKTEELWEKPAEPEPKPESVEPTGKHLQLRLTLDWREAGEEDWMRIDTTLQSLLDKLNDPNLKKMTGVHVTPDEQALLDMPLKDIVRLAWHRRDARRKLEAKKEQEKGGQG